MSDLAEYTAAYRALVAAQEEPEPDMDLLIAAEERFRAAEEPLRSLIDAAWAENVAAVQAAKAKVQETALAKLAVERAVGDAARSRNPNHPVLSVDEIAQTEAAWASWLEARNDLSVAHARFKAGVTPEQLEG